MARISTYGLDDSLERDDKIVGTDTSSNNATMNFSLQQLGEFFSGTGLAQASVAFPFDVGGEIPTGNSIEPGHIFYDVLEFGDLTEVVISNKTNSGVDVKGLVSAFEGQTIALNQVGLAEGYSYGFFTVESGSVEELTGPSGINGYKFTVAIQATDTFEGLLPGEETDYMAITPLGAAGAVGPKGDQGDKGDKGAMLVQPDFKDLKEPLDHKVLRVMMVEKEIREIKVSKEILEILVMILSYLDLQGDLKENKEYSRPRRLSSDKEDLKVYLDLKEK